MRQGTGESAKTYSWKARTLELHPDLFVAPGDSAVQTGRNDHQSNVHV